MNILYYGVLRLLLLLTHALSPSLAHLLLTGRTLPDPNLYRIELDIDDRI